MKRTPGKTIITKPSLKIPALAFFSLAFAGMGVFFLTGSYAQSASVVTIQNSKLYVNGSQYKIRGINYHPIYIGSDQLDTNAPSVDVPKIKAMGANTIGTYMMGKSEYAQYSDITSGDQFYQNLMPAAEQAGLKVVVGYYSNETIDWTNAARVAKVTTQYQDLVTKAKTSPATLTYLIGNEIFEKMSDNNQKTAYARWIGSMVNWTHQNDPNHPVMYADRSDSPGLSWLKQYAPSLDIYGVNNYSFTSASQLKSLVQNYANAWPGKLIVTHEWGADSLNVSTGQVDTTMQSNAVSALAQAVDTTSNDTTLPYAGGLGFEFTDDWRFVGSPSTQDKDAGWSCPSCGDGRANEDFWGLMSAAASGKASTRTYKPAYYALQSLWASGGGTTTPPPSSTNPPSISITSPANGAYIMGIVPISVNTSSTAGIQSVDIYIDGKKKTTDSSAPYSYEWDTSRVKAGQHTISVTSRANDGKTTTTSIVVSK